MTVFQHKEKKHKMRGKREVFLLLDADDLAHGQDQCCLFGFIIYSYDYSIVNSLVPRLSLCTKKSDRKLGRAWEQGYTIKLTAQYEVDC